MTNKTRGLRSLGGILGQILKISEPRQIIYQNDALGHVITLKWFSRSPDPKYGVFEVNWGKNIQISEPRQNIYRFEALAHSVTKKGFSMSSDPKLEKGN